ncbi:SWIM zinc finger family protein [Streptomyces sp. 142MFCol3.1]|uniref:SWIM zinc finger family protein n=1 Tax=Streptomyces sp. 142MFCol3.1 TaxID=1172179 RepID=UPI0004071436|nr:SWIM zinc finger family protein [Streptomyces sp. 142MFCol3.1]
MTGGAAEERPTTDAAVDSRPVTGAAQNPRPVTGARPADEARRALRAARERGAGAKTPAPAPSAMPGDDRDELLSVPGDDRDELPSVPGAASMRGETSAPGDASGADGPGSARAAGGRGPRPADSPASGAAGRGARPGDVAREALRAARDEARRARADAAADETEPERRRPTDPVFKGVEDGSRSAESRTGRRAAPPGRRRRDPEPRARELRELLAGAFRMPTDDADGPENTYAPAERPQARPRAAGREPAAGRPERPSDLPPTAPDAVPGDNGDAGDADDGGRRGRSALPGGSLPAAPTPTPWRPGDEDETPRAADPAGSGARYRAAADSPSGEPDDLSEPPRGGRTARPGSGHGGSAEAREARPGTADRAALTGDRLPRSMASPGRDGELRRTFAAFPARMPQTDAFAETWWGNAWVSALEEGALDAARLARGRTYAGHGHVDAITVTPGLLLAYVHGTRPRPYRVQVGVRTLPDEDWDRFLDAAAERPGHIAALLDKQMPRSLAECGVALLPGPDELEPRCSCPDSGRPCKHAAALCYQAARLLDEDPFVLLLLRGRGERELLDALSRRSAARAARAARAAQEQEPAPVPGVRARDVLATRALPPLPAPLPPPAHPEQPPTYPGVPGGPDPFALDQLATDAAARAHALITTGRDPVAELTLWQDAVRIAAARPGSGLTAATRALYASLASASGRTATDLARAVAAWRQGGYEALRVLEEPWDPPAGRFDRARPLLLAADLPAFRPWRNHLTHPRGHAQLRLGQNGLWYAYESEPGHDDWWPRGTPDLDPVGALTGLGAPGEL